MTYQPIYPKHPKHYALAEDFCGQCGAIIRLNPYTGEWGHVLPNKHFSDGPDGTFGHQPFHVIIQPLDEDERK